MNPYRLTLLMLCSALLAACNWLPAPMPSVAPTPTLLPPKVRPPHPTQPAPIIPASPTRTQPINQPTSQPVLLFDIGMHIEPFGAAVSQIVAGNAAPPRATQQQQGGNFNHLPFFKRHVEDIRTVAALIEKHGGRMTVQTQSPFTTQAIQSNDSLLADLEARGHEIALHFHEDAHLGKNANALPAETWCAVMKEEIALIHQAGAKKPIRFWSGGNLYPHLLQAAACAGLDVNSDWKNPQTQTTAPALIGIHPWRPAGGANGSDVSQFAQHNPNGKIIYLPDGIFARTDFNSMRRSDTTGGDQAYFEFLKQSLLQSLAAAESGKTNVFHITIHSGEFRGDPKNPFGVIDQFLTNVVDPLVKQGKVKWATFSEMADTYKGSQPSTLQPPTSNCSAYMTFVINTHDWNHVTESADTLLRFIALFEKYDVRGDFYLTAPTVEAYVKQRPDVIERLKNSAMTISYHIRPPHPAYPGFDNRLKKLDDKTLEQTLRDYETYRLDLATGDLDKRAPGGYTYVAQVFGRKPVVASPMSNDPRIRKTLLKIYAEMGAQMQVLYHEEGTAMDQPLVQQDGLWVRPSDFSITRIRMDDGRENFWWNLMGTPRASEFDPTTMLKNQLAKWNAPRAPFITSLIHEDNLYGSGTGWAGIYYANGDQTQPLAPPYNLNAPDTSKPRSAESQNAIWQAYETMLAYASKNLCVITSQDIVTSNWSSAGNVPSTPSAAAPTPRRTSSVQAARVCLPEKKSIGIPDPNGPAFHQVALAKSSDGLTWQSDKRVIIDQASVPEGLRLSDGRWIIYAVDGSALGGPGLVYAESKDEGKTWACSQINLQGADPDAVVLPDGRIRLYYIEFPFGPNPPVPGSPQANQPNRVKSAISSDGKHFTIEEGARLEGVQYTDPDVIRVGSDWFMYVSTGATAWAAQSSDGLNFKLIGKVNQTGAVSGSFLFPDGTLRHYFCGRDGILSATSANGASVWQAEAGARIASSPDWKIVCDPSIVPDGKGGYWMPFKIQPH